MSDFIGDNKNDVGQTIEPESILVKYVKELRTAKKQGALEELKRIYKSISVFHAEDCIDLKLIEKRIKELEGVSE